jgi:predicted negative regulator of RcsB-dependent stress response
MMTIKEEADNLGRSLRSFVRASAVAAIVVGVIAFFVYPGYTNWDGRKILAAKAADLAAATSIISLLVSSIPAIANSTGRRSRPMFWCNCLNILTIVLFLMTPAT